MFEVAALSTCRRNTCVEEVEARIHWEPTMDEFGDADAGTNGQVVERSAVRVPIDLVRDGWVPFLLGCKIGAEVGGGVRRVEGGLEMGMDGVSRH